MLEGLSTQKPVRNIRNRDSYVQEVKTQTEIFELHSEIQLPAKTRNLTDLLRIETNLNQSMSIKDETKLLRQLTMPDSNQMFGKLSGETPNF